MYGIHNIFIKCSIPPAFENTYIRRTHFGYLNVHILYVCTCVPLALCVPRYHSTSSGEREIQRTMLELLNQLDGFDSRGDVKVRLPLEQPFVQLHTSYL